MDSWGRSFFVTKSCQKRNVPAVNIVMRREKNGSCKMYKMWKSV